MPKMTTRLKNGLTIDRKDFLLTLQKTAADTATPKRLKSLFLKSKMKFKILLSDEKRIFRIAKNSFLYTDEFNYLKYSLSVASHETAKH